MVNGWKSLPRFALYPIDLAYRCDSGKKKGFSYQRYSAWGFSCTRIGIFGCCLFFPKEEKKRALPKIKSFSGNMTDEVKVVKPLEVDEDLPKKEVKRVPPGRQLITRRFTVYAIIITCLIISIVLVVMAGVLFSQSQLLQPLQPSNPPVVSQLVSPQSNIEQGFVMMSPKYAYTVSFGNDLQLFTTATFGGRLLWFSGSTTATVSEVKYQENYDAFQQIEYLPWQQRHKAQVNSKTGGKCCNQRIRVKEFTNTRQLQFSDTGILSITDMSGSIIWQNMTTPAPPDTYYLQLLDTGVFRIVNSSGTVFWAVNETSPSAVLSTNSASTFPANRLLNPGMTLTNGMFQFLFDSRTGQFRITSTTTTTTTGSTTTLWVSNAPSLTSLFTAAFTSYGNLILYDQDRNTVWNSETCTLLPSPFPFNMNLNESGLLQLQFYDGMDFVTFFETTTNGSNQVIRHPAPSWSRSSPFSFTRTSYSQLVIQSPDERSKLIYESDGSLTLYQDDQVISSTGLKKGQRLILHGLEVDTIVPELVGSLALYGEGSSTPLWSFQPVPALTVPLTQLPITLSFQSEGRLCLVTQDQSIVASGLL